MFEQPISWTPLPKPKVSVALPVPELALGAGGWGDHGVINF